MEAAVAVCKCQKTGKTFGIRCEKREYGWIYNWAFALNERSIAREGYGGVVVLGGIMMDEEYPGCPDCGVKYFFVCQCGKLTCYNGRARRVTCKWCGSSGTLGGYVDSINLQGNY